MKRFSHTLAGAALVALLAAPAAAQEDGLKPIEDLEGWLEEDAIPDTPASAGEADPLAPEAPAAPRELTPEERARNERQIQRNYDEAEKIYEGIIGADPVAPLDRRIANNERIVSEYRQRIRTASEERRELQVQLYNRTFYLKQQLEQGKLNRDAYDRMIVEEERKYEQRNKVLRGHIEAWKQEYAAANARLTELKSKRQMLLAQRPRALRGKHGTKAAQRRARPGEALLGTLRERLRRVGQFSTRHTMDGVHPRELSGGVTAMTSLGDLGGGGDLGEADDFGGADDLDLGGDEDW